jgi:hypothetical protein
VSVFVFALIVTSELVASILADKAPDLILASKASLLRWREILWFSLKAFVICLAIFSALTVTLVLRRPDLLKSPIFVESLLLIGIALCAAPLLMPGTMRLLLNSKLAIVDSHTRWAGVLLTAFAAASLGALHGIISTLESGVVLDSRALLVVSIWNELLVDAPLAALFIGLSVLSTKLKTTL